MNLKKWLTKKRGRAASLAAHLGVTEGRISQIADEGVPMRDMLRVREFTKNSVTLEDMVNAKTVPLARPEFAKEAAGAWPCALERNALQASSVKRRTIKDQRVNSSAASAAHKSPPPTSA